MCYIFLRFFLVEKKRSTVQKLETGISSMEIEKKNIEGTKDSPSLVTFCDAVFSPERMIQSVNNEVYASATGKLLLLVYHHDHHHHHHRPSLLVENWAASPWLPLDSVCSRNCCLSLGFQVFLAVLLHVSRGRPLLLLPSGIHARAMRGLAF